MQIQVRKGAVLALLGLIGLVAPANAGGQEPEAAAGAVDFQREIAPIFAAHCLSCHGPQRQESSYRLDRRSAALAHGDLELPTIVPGDVPASLLLRYVSGPDPVTGAEPDLVMPPEGEGQPLSPDQIDRLERWIAAGAVWPEEEEAGAGQLQRPVTDHWSFQALADPPVPAALPPLPVDRATNEIDRFIAAGLQNAGLQFSPPADRATLLRRLHLDVLGLLPTPQQVQQFESDPAPAAWQRAVDDALASPHYGERWARYWLDLVRFGESTGYEVNRDRAHGWWYRDYVIDALNSDRSYRDFVIEQLAGDQLGVDEATGFLVGGPNDIVKSPDPQLTLMQRQDELADYVNTTSTTFLGLTVACARCHNHKFDPILQRDYFALQGFFTGVRHGERPLWRRGPPGAIEQRETLLAGLRDQERQLAERAAAAPPAAAPPADLWPAVQAGDNVDTFAPREADRLRFLVERSFAGEPCLDELEVFSVDGVNVAHVDQGTRARSSGDFAGDPKHRLVHLNDGRYGNESSWIADRSEAVWVELEFSRPQRIERVVWGRDRKGQYHDRLAEHYRIEVSLQGGDWQTVSDSLRRKPRDPEGAEAEGAWIARLPEQERDAATGLLESVRSLRKSLQELEASFPPAYVGTFVDAEPVYRLHRGDPMSPREEVQPEILSVMEPLNLPADLSEPQRRLALAHWIASPQNPLTARVIVNRVWQFHFGRGLVATPSDFGRNGARPSHPALLDWLALRFMEQGWSLKWLHREILTSATWCQSSRPDPESLQRDAEANWLWRFPPRRLEAEAIRDCILQASGKLDLKAGGPGFLLFRVDRENVHHYFPLEQFGPEHFRRMIYMTKIRQEQESVFGVFDCPDGGQTIPVRNQSTTPLQALNLLNSSFMMEQSAFLAERLRSEGAVEPEQQVRAAFRQLLLREPAAEELADYAGFIRQSGLEDFCRALLNANEFLFLQ